MKQKIRDYYSLVKPGVLYGNALTAVAGFLFASFALPGAFNIWLGLALTIGSTLVIASACALNNYLDQDIDRVMERTKKRAIVSGAVSSRGALVFSIIIGIIGLSILTLWTNWLVVAVGIAGFVTYVWLYGATSKRRSIHGTVVGSISGAMPILAGYVAVSGAFDIAALVVFVIMFTWQFGEFYSIAIYRRKEYAAAKIPLLPIVKGVHRTKIEILIYTIVYVASTIVLTPLGYTGYVYLAIMLITGLWWLWIALKAFSADDDDAWARRMFRFSMVTVLVLCIMLPLGPLLP